MPSCCATALLEACSNRVPRRPYRACANTAEPAKPTVKGSKIAEAPRICTVAPPTANRPVPSPAAPANGKPVTHHTAATARRGAGLGAQTKPAPTALDATAAGVRTAFGRAATTVATFTDPPQTRRHPHYGETAIRASSRRFFLTGVSARSIEQLVSLTVLIYLACQPSGRNSWTSC